MKVMIVFIGILFFATFLSIPAFAKDSNLPTNFGIIVYPNQGWYTAKDLQNNIIINSNIPEVVIKTALDRGGDIYIAGGTYQLSQDFTGFNLKTGTHLKLSQDAKIIVPSGYKGYVFGFYGRAANCIIDGGIVDEANPIKRNWTAIMMQAGTIYFNLVENMIVNNPYVVIDLVGNQGYFINANTFVNIQGTYFVRGIQFDFNGVLVDGNGIYGNTFRDLQFQSGDMTTYGVKDIKHGNNAFYNVQFWDLPLGSKSSTIDPSATNTLIVGGQMTNYGFIDDGVKTTILDAWHNNLPANSTLLSTILGETRPSGVNATSVLLMVSNVTSDIQIKNDAKLWSQSKISNDIFGSRLQYLVKIGIIEKPNENQALTNQSVHIPTWFKKNAGWWADEQISTSDFISTMQYLINMGIIQLSLS